MTQSQPGRIAIDLEPEFVLKALEASTSRHLIRLEFSKRDKLGDGRRCGMTTHGRTLGMGAARDVTAPDGDDAPGRGDALAHGAGRTLWAGYVTPQVAARTPHRVPVSSGPMHPLKRAHSSQSPDLSRRQARNWAR